MSEDSMGLNDVCVRYRLWYHPVPGLSLPQLLHCARCSAAWTAVPAARPDRGFAGQLLDAVSRYVAGQAAFLVREGRPHWLRTCWLTRHQAAGFSMGMRFGQQRS